MLVHGAAVHQRLCDDRQTRVDDNRLVHVKHDVGVCDNVHPETQRQTTTAHDTGPALGMFEVFGRTRPQNLGGGRNFGPKNPYRLNLLAHLNDCDVYAANTGIYAAA